MKRICACLCVILTMLTLMGGRGQAEGVVMNEKGLIECGENIYIRDLDMDGDVFYIYASDMSLYRYEINKSVERVCTLERFPEKLRYLPTIPDEDGAERLDRCVTNIAVQRGTIYGYNVYTGRACTIDSDGPHWLDIELDFSPLFPFWPEDSLTVYPILQSITLGDSLLIYVDNTVYAGSERQLLKYDLRSGKLDIFKLDGLCGITRRDDARALCMLRRGDNMEIVELDAATGKTSPLYSVREPSGAELLGIACSHAGSGIMALGDNALYRIDDRGETEKAVDLTTYDISYRARGWVTSNGTYVYFHDHLTVVDEEKPIEGRLTIAGWPEMSVLDQYRRLYPNVVVEIGRDLSVDDFSARLATRDTSVDIYTIWADYSFWQIKNKGMTASLSSSELISENVAHMYPEIADVITDDDGVIRAFPIRFDIWKYYINMGFWKLIFGEDKPLPETYSELLDAGIEWERELSDLYPDIDFFDSGFNYPKLLQNFVELYIRKNASGDLLSITGPEITEIFEKLELMAEIRQSKGKPIDGSEALEIESRFESGYPCIYMMMVRNPMYENSAGQSAAGSNDRVYGVSIHAFEEVDLRFTDEVNPHTEGFMMVSFINPYSENYEAALRFMELYTSVDNVPALQYAICPDLVEPLVRKNYEKFEENALREKAEYETALERDELTEEAAAAIQERLNYLNETLGDETIKYQIGKNPIIWFHGMVLKKPLAFHIESPYIINNNTSIGETIRGECEKAAQGLITAKDALERMERMVTMIYLEEDQDVR